MMLNPIPYTEKFLANDVLKRVRWQFKTRSVPAIGRPDVNTTDGAAVEPTKRSSKATPSDLFDRHEQGELF